MPSDSTIARSYPRRRRTSESDDGVSSSWDSHSTSSRSTASSDRPLAAQLPTLPDLRFEQSYLATIRGFLHEESPSDATSHEERPEQTQDHHHKVEVARSKQKDEHELWLGNLRVEWFPILYVTVRDQLLSPLVQGAVWGLAGLLYTQTRQYLSAARATRASRTQARGAPRSILRSLGLGSR